MDRKRERESSSLHEYKLKRVQEIAKQQVIVTVLLSKFRFCKHHLLVLPLLALNLMQDDAKNNNSTGQKYHRGETRRSVWCYSILIVHNNN